jgi:hypothetical protein
MGRDHREFPGMQKEKSIKMGLRQMDVKIYTEFNCYSDQL